MKKLMMVGMVFALAWLTLARAATDDTHAFFGEIADSQCAMNFHSLSRSHQEMLKSKSMGGTGASCALYCIKYLGGDFVLATKSDVYRLDAQEKVAKFAGEKVKIVGTQPKKGTIHIVIIEPDNRPTSAESAKD
jgi:hypothetical protein